ncbi:hypothetical protein V2J09_008324, partial [Rumex salicifolius]
FRDNYRKWERRGVVKKALSPDPKEKKDQRNSKPKKSWFGKQKGTNAIPLSNEPPKSASNVPLPLPPLPTSQPIEETKYYEVEERNQDKHAYTVAVATAAADAAVAAAQAAAEVVRLTTVSHYYYGKSKEEIAAIRIQTAFRGHLARRALRALRGLVRLKSLVESQSVKRQVTNTLKCMQTVARLQSQIRARRIRLSEENLALQKQLQQKHDLELEQQRMGEDWVDSTQSKEKIEAGLQSKQEAAMRRERALAYAYSHQMRKNSKSTNPTFMDPNNPHWGWSWLERWMASRPWEANKDINDHASVKSSASRSLSVTPSTQRVGRPPSRQSPSRGNSANPQSRIRQSPRINGWGAATPDYDSKSAVSVQSERPRRHSIAGSLVRDNDNLASSPVVPSYMASTQSAKAKLGGSIDKNGGTPDKVSSMASAKKRLSFPASPSGPRRHSVPGKMESNELSWPISLALQKAITKLSIGSQRYCSARD